MKVAVVGLGIAGLSIALRLAEAGHEIDGFEQFDLLHKQGSSHGDTRIFRGTPGEGDLYVGLAARAERVWKEWSRAAPAPLFTPCAGYMAGPPGSRFVAACVDLARAHGRDAETIGGAELARRTRGQIRLEEDWRAVRQDDCGVLRADAARAFLIARARAAGARLTAHARVAAPIDGPRLTIDGRTYAFDRVIVAAGAWARRLLPETAAALRVQRRVVGWFKPKTDAPAPPILCVDDDQGLFAMPAPDATYKIGLHVVGEAIADPDHVRAPDAADAERLAAVAAARLPLHEPAPLRVERCLYTLTPDENFLIAPARADARVLLFSACSGHGFKYAPVYGELAHAWLAGESAALAGFGRAERRERATGLGAPAPPL